MLNRVPHLFFIFCALSYGLDLLALETKGATDLSLWNPDKVKEISLKGNWGFYWKKLLDPIKIQKGEIPKGEWRSSKGVWSGKRGSTGYASYLMKVEGLRPGKYVLGKTYIYNSFKIFVISPQKIQKVFDIGDVSKKKMEDAPFMDNLAGSFSVGENPFYILVQVSNYSFRNGGIYGLLKLTAKNQHDEDRVSSMALDSFVIGSLIIVAIYHYFIFFLRPQDKLSLWFASAVFFLALRAYFGSGYIHWAFTDNSFFGLNIKSRLYYLTFYPSALFFSTFLNHVLEENLNKKFMKVVEIHFYILTFLTLFFSVEYYANQYILYSFYLLLFFGVLYILSTFCVLIFKKQYHFVPSFIPTFVLCSGALHDIVINFYVDNPMYITSYMIVIFIILQSYNIAKKNSIAHNTAEKLSKDLEKEVKIQTKEAVDAKEKAEFSEKKVSDLINNMRQSVFIIGNDGQIIDPISTFSQEIFGENIQGKDIYETLYKNLDTKSEMYSKILTCLAHIFDADDLQWLMMHDLLPQRVLYRKDDESSEKILRVVYTPLYNVEDKLERLMLVIEDITEVENLEKQMLKEREEGSKKSHVIQELVANKKEDLNLFFSDTIKAFKRSLAIWKNIRVLILEKRPLIGLDILLRDLHTIKGNSRIYGLTHISKVTHRVETEFTRMRKIPFDEWTQDYLSQFTQELYDLQGQINEYLWLAEEILGVESEEDKKIKEEYHEGLKELEYWLGHLHHPFYTKVSDESDDFGLLEKVETLEPEYCEQIFSSIKRSFHGVKGIARTTGNKELSNIIHLAESMIFKMEERTASPEEIKEDLFPALETMRRESSLIFYNSSLFDSLNITVDLWSDIFLEYFNVLHLWKNKSNLDTAQFNRSMYLLYGKTSGDQLYYIPVVIRTLYDFLEVNLKDSEDKIEFCLKKIWEFLVTIIMLDTNYKVDPSFRKVLIENLNNLNHESDEQIDDLIQISKGFNLKSETGESLILLSTLKKILSAGNSIDEFVGMISYFNLGNEDNYYNLVPSQDLSFKFNDIYIILKQVLKDGKNDFSLLDELSSNSENDNELELVNFIKSFLSHENPIWFQYLLKIDLIRLLKNYGSVDEMTEQETRPETYDVLSENFYRAKSSIADLIEKEENKKYLDFYFHGLLEIPLKYSFRNIKTMVNDIGKSLGKKIVLNLRGDQCSMDKESLSLLKDAVIHLVRNAIDHGIEFPTERIKNGKSDVGEIVIHCRDEGLDKIKIEIKDNGQGINEDIICKKAVEKGLLKKEEVLKLSDEERIKIIFRPGFSTKEEVTEISGRGIGMDVVKMNLEKIGGDIKIKNKQGKGTQFDISLNKKIRI
ncbi:ATP-binding protein [Bacteriovoracales bacterium]|nr:ATP-binding protein [Bacteriovoracales bacterium]